MAEAPAPDLQRSMQVDHLGRSVLSLLKTTADVASALLVELPEAEMVALMSLPEAGTRMALLNLTSQALRVLEAQAGAAGFQRGGGDGTDDDAEGGSSDDGEGDGGGGGGGDDGGGLAQQVADLQLLLGEEQRVADRSRERAKAAAAALEAKLAESRAECAELRREQQNDAQGVGERKARPGPVI